MTRKISDIFKEKDRTCSFELFPPKTDEGRSNLMDTVSALKELEPDWFSVTYGAGGNTRELTMEIVDEIQRRFHVPTIHHFTCVCHSQADLEKILDTMKSKDICNVLALHGDPPRDVENHEPGPDEFQYAYQLVRFIRSLYGDYFSIGVAGFPEGHINSPDKETDARYLKIKLDEEADFVITQLFFDNNDYFDYLERVNKLGIDKRIIPGILPITDYRNLLRFCEICGAGIPRRVHDIFSPLDGDEEATHKAGVEFAVEQCNDLLKRGAPGLHFFTLNRVDPTREILNKISM